MAPGMVEKFAAAKTPGEKPSSQYLVRGALSFMVSLSPRFELLKLFIMDPTLESVTVESYFQEFPAQDSTF